MVSRCLAGFVDVVPNCCLFRAGPSTDSYGSAYDDTFSLVSDSGLREPEEETTSKDWRLKQPTAHYERIEVPPYHLDQAVSLAEGSWMEHRAPSRPFRRYQSQRF